MTVPYIDPAILKQSGVVGRAYPPPEFYDVVIATINAMIDELGGNITEVIAGVNLDGGGSTGSVTIDVSPNIDLAGASSVQTIIARKAAAAQTDNAGSVILANNTGTYDTTGAATTFKQIGVYGRSQGTKSGGVPDLENWGTYGEAGGSNIAIGALGWAISGVASALNYGVFGQANAAAGSTVMGVVGYAGHGVLTKFAPDPGDLGGIFSGIFRGGTLKSESDFWHTGTNAGFFSATPTTKPTVSGSRNGNAALASALTGLAGLGLLTDSSTAGTAGISYQVGYYSDAGANAIDPGDTTAIIANITGEGGSTFSLAAGNTEGHTIQIILESGNAIATTEVEIATLDDSEAGTTVTFPHTAPASLTLVWSDVNQLWYVVSLRNATIA